MQLDDHIRAWNPWWSNPAAITTDPHLAALDSAQVRWAPPLLEHLPLALGDTHTLRGPRQAGKTTLTKWWVRRLIEAGQRRVLYFSFDLQTHPGAIHDVIRRAKQLHPEPEGPWYLFLDEVTSVADWQKGVKTAWDQGLTRDDFMLLTGSSARDLRTGAEQLTGRRGDGSDYLHLPLSFRDFCRQVENIDLPGPASGIEAFLQPDGVRLAKELSLITAELERAYRAYRQIGGFPAAIQDYARTRTPVASPATLKMLWSAIAGDVARSGRNQTAAVKLLEKVAVSLGSPLKWSGAAKAMGLSSHHSAREYVELLSESFALLTVYFWDLSGGTLQPSKQRKVYYTDPLLAAIPAALVPGARTPPLDGMVENTVAVGLFRSATNVLMQAGAVPGAVGYWRSSKGRELDFVVPATRSGRAGRMPLEVKGDNAAGIAGAQSAIRRAFGNGIVTSATILDLSGDVPVIPVPVLLAGLADVPERTSPLG